ncbi:hypothetical protein DJ529_07270 [Sulfolobus sp. C3]|nr:hypothetical protein DJ529_07270 [Sulfolobus sp. C3]TRM93760.1 hypothetical protein DJ526_02855 [Sulfolobus sp. A20-N-G8]
MLQQYIKVDLGTLRRVSTLGYAKYIWLTPSISLDLEGMNVFRGVNELPILGYLRSLSFYKDWEIREASFKEWDAYLKISLLMINP